MMHSSPCQSRMQRLLLMLCGMLLCTAHGLALAQVPNGAGPTKAISVTSSSEAAITPMSAFVPMHRTLKLKSTISVEEYSFTEQGHVSATFGQVNGPLAAPLLSYRVLDENRIELQGMGEPVIWKKVTVTQDSVVIERNGKRSEFAVSNR